MISTIAISIIFLSLLSLQLFLQLFLLLLLFLLFILLLPLLVLLPWLLRLPFPFLLLLLLALFGSDSKTDNMPNNGNINSCHHNTNSSNDEMIRKTIARILRITLYNMNSSGSPDSSSNAIAGKSKSAYHRDADNKNSNNDSDNNNSDRSNRRTTEVDIMTVQQYW